MTNRMADQTHREMFPEQYSHPLVGKQVTITPPDGPPVQGTVERVFASRFGPLCTLAEHGGVMAWRTLDIRRTPLEWVDLLLTMEQAAEQATDDLGHQAWCVGQANVIRKRMHRLGLCPVCGHEFRKVGLHTCPKCDPAF